MAISKEKMRMQMAPTKAEGPENDEPQEWEVKDAADTLMRAEDIKKNKKLMPHVHKHITKKLQSLKDLKKMAVQKDLDQDNDQGSDQDQDGI